MMATEASQVMSIVLDFEIRLAMPIVLAIRTLQSCRSEHSGHAHDTGSLDPIVHANNNGYTL